MSQSSLFFPLIDEARLHPQFRSLRDSPEHAEARQLMDELHNRMGDPNGGFVSYFQTAHFHSRLFELACFAYLESAGLSIDRSMDRPDFLVSNGKYSLTVEAVTANPSDNQGADISVGAMSKPDEKEIAHKVAYEFPKRMRNLFRKKLSKQYQELPQCKGKPIVLMVAPFFEPGSTTYTDDALIPNLYGAPPDSDEEIEAFFMSESASPISAIAYCNSFTVSKFFRLATDLSKHKGMYGIREGMSYVENSASENMLRTFRHEMGSPSTPVETWSEGVTIFKNPCANFPLIDGVLPASSIISVEDGYVTRKVFGFHPVMSFMVIQVAN